MAEETTNQGNWYDSYDQPTREHMQAKGWLNPDMGQVALKAIQAHAQAEKLIGAPPEQVMRLPKGADDPSFFDAYNRVAAIGQPKEYALDGLKHKDGSEPKPEFIGSVKELAAELKLPQASAVRVANWALAQRDEGTVNAAQLQQTQLAANNLALQRNWGDKHDFNAYLANKGAEVAGMPKETMDMLRAQPTDVFLKTMDAFRVLGSRMEEAPTLGDGSQARDQAGNPGTMSREQAMQEKQRLMGDKEWGKKWFNGDDEARTLMDNLNRIIVMGPR